MASIDFENARAKGIVCQGAVDFMAFDSVDGRVVVNAEKTAKMFAQDAAITSNNIGVPSAFTTYLDPRVVPVLFGATAATKLFPEIKQGDWTKDFANFPVEEISGDVSGYSDYGNAVTSEVNYEFPVREQYRFQTAIKYGDLEQDKAAAAKIALASRKQFAAAEIIARASNRFYLYGVANKQIYGALNDPNLNASISPISVNSKSTWADKQAADPDTFANVCYNDINKLWVELASKNGGNIDANSRIVLAISNSAAPYLNVPNSFGLTAMAMLKQNFPSLEVVQVPELSTNSGEELYMVVPEVLGVETGNTAYGDKFRLGRLVPELSSYTQKAVGTTWGTIIRRPSLVARMLGV